MHLYQNSIIGSDCIIHSGVVIGADGYGFISSNDGHIKIPQLGKAVIGNNVEIGAYSTIDCGTIGDTTIGDMCKLDNGVQIAHNVSVGKGCLLTAHVTIAGSTKIGEFCAFGGQAGAIDNVTIWKQNTAFTSNVQNQQSTINMNNLAPNEDYTTAITADFTNGEQEIKFSILSGENCLPDFKETISSALPFITIFFESSSLPMKPEFTHPSWELASPFNGSAKQSDLKQTSELSLIIISLPAIAEPTFSEETE